MRRRGVALQGGTCDVAAKTAKGVHQTATAAATQGGGDEQRATKDVDALGIFTFLWAQVMVLQVIKLFIQAREATWPPSRAVVLWPAIMTSACFAGAVFPSSGLSTIFLVVAGFKVLWSTGSQSNHVFMDMVVCLAILLTYSRDRRIWQAQATHAIRLFLVGLYLVTALHKMNADWADVSWSCCTLMMGGILALPPLRPFLGVVPWAAFPALATITEVGLPLLIWTGSAPCLCLAAIQGSLFHVAICQMLSPMSVYPFSVLMAPLYVFVIPEAATVAFKSARRWAKCLLVLYAVLCAVWTPLMASDLPAGEVPFEYPPYGCWAPGVVWCNLVYAFLLFAAFWGQTSAVSGAGLRVTPTWSGRLLASAVVVFGLTPYLGVRTYPALAMFSNLRTEGGRSNHLIFGDDLDLLGWQRDYVVVHETDIPALILLQVDLGPLFTPATKQALITAGIQQEFWITPPLKAWPYSATREFLPYAIPFLELRRRVAPLRATNATGRVRYTRTEARPRLVVPQLWKLLGKAWLDEDRVWANLTYDLAVGGDPELEQPLPRWQALVARFRPFDTEYSPCRH